MSSVIRFHKRIVMLFCIIPYLKVHSLQMVKKGLFSKMSLGMTRTNPAVDCLRTTFMLQASLFGQKLLAVGPDWGLLFKGFAWQCQSL